MRFSSSAACCFRAFSTSKAFDASEDFEEEEGAVFEAEDDGGVYEVDAPFTMGVGLFTKEVSTHGEVSGLLLKFTSPKSDVLNEGDDASLTTPAYAIRLFFA